MDVAVAPERAETLDEIVRVERARRKWTQDELAARSGVSQTTIVKIEAGARVGLDSVAHVLVALGHGHLTLGQVVDLLGAGRAPESTR